MTDGIVKGHVEEAEIGAGRFTVHREPNPSRVPVVAVGALVVALDACKPGIESAFGWAWLHGQRYDGPTYNQELERVRSILGTEGGESK